MDDDADAGMLRAHVLDLPDGETGVNGAMTLPEDHPRPIDSVGLEIAPDFIGIPDDHLIERDAELVRSIASEMLIRQEENAFAARPGPFQGRGGVRRGADDPAAL